jgi:CubicO group peptidase (beta-lactamase class C family)
MKTHPNPDLSVLDDNKQRWNHPAHRRHGFHNAHQLFRRSWMFRARNVLELTDAPNSELATSPEIARLVNHSAFSALVLLKNDALVYSKSAKDFSIFQPHSIQSVTKLHIHLIVGQLLAQGQLDLDQCVGHYLPDIGTGYANATLQMLLDMDVANDFSEDYADPNSDCYTEEMALGWRLPSGDAPEPSLSEFTAGITGSELQNPSESADYKSANTDVLTQICARVSPVPLNALIENIVDAAGYEGAFYISVSPDQLPAFSGGGCISAIDLARFGLLLTRGGTGCANKQVGNRDFFNDSRTRVSKPLNPPKEWLRYSNHLMTNGKIAGHAGYGGQYLFANIETGVVVAFMSVLENDAGYDSVYMGSVAQDLAALMAAVGDF